MKKHPAILILGTLLLASPTMAYAQTSAGEGKLSELVPTLYFDNVVADVALINREFFRFDPEVFGLIALPAVSQALLVSSAINTSVATQLTSFPLGSAAGGFNWTYDPALGTFHRVSTSFGSSFVERGLTIGRRRLNLGMSYQRATFDGLEGHDLRDGDIKVYAGLTCKDVGLNCDDAFFIEESLSLKLATNTVGLFATYGVSDRLDLGVAVPIVSVKMDASLTTRVGTRQTDLVPDPSPFVDARSGDASGIGDIVLRGKYNLSKTPGVGLALGVDWRLPTGDEEDLLGVAGWQGKFYFAGSRGQGRMSPHVNFGFTMSGESSAAQSRATFVFTPPDEVNYSGGFDFAATPRLTVTGDLIGRNLRGTDVLDKMASRFRQGIQEFQARNGNLNLLLGGVSVKYNAFGRALLAANILMPLNSTGMYDKLTWALGFEYSF
jgi:hypothetical protein